MNNTWITEKELELRKQFIDRWNKEEGNCVLWGNPAKTNSTQGLRYNEGKTRYDLFEPHAMEELAKIFTKGATKYAARNWEKGMSWTSVLASLKRHLAAFEKGEDNDPESELLHVAHVAWNALALTTFYKTSPQYDDRNHSYLHEKKVGIDIDGVIADFNGAINDIIGNPHHAPVDWGDPALVKAFNTIKTSEEFWTNLKPLVHPRDIPFEPHCYITSRSISEECTRAWLDQHGFPDAPLYCVGSGESKVDIAKQSGIDFFIDDYYRNFVELNKAGICTFLMSRSWNGKYNVGYKRIKDFNDFKTRFL